MKATCHIKAKILFWIKQLEIIVFTKYICLRGFKKFCIFIAEVYLAEAASRGVL